MKAKCLIIYLLILAQLSCNNKNSTIDNIRTVNFCSDKFMETENILFDTIVSELDYVVLETTPDCLISHIGGITITDSEILIMGRNTILIFDRQGSFISQLGSTGRGPKEYSSPLNIMYNDKTKVYTVDDYKHILQFDRDHRFIRKIKKPDNLKRLHQLHADLFVAERRVEPFFGDSIVYSLEFFDSDFNTIMKHPSPEPTDLVEGHNFLVDLMGGISYWEEGLLFRETYGDTIYTISGSMSVEPLLVLDFGAEKWEKEFNFNFALFDEHVKNYLIPGMFAYKENRLISQFSLFGKSAYTITDISENINYLAYNNECDLNRFVLLAFPGSNFRPSFTKDYLSNIIYATDAIKTFDPDTETISEEQKERILALSEDDNPVLVLGKL